MASNLQTKATYDSIVVDLEKLFDTTSQCEQCIAVLGTDQDTLEFRQVMTLHIRNATSLCRAIKSNFNQLPCAPPLDIQTLQQSFISLHSELKDAVNKIKVKTKKYEPHNADTHKHEREHLSNHLKSEKAHARANQNHNDMNNAHDDIDTVVNRKQILKEGWLYKKSRHLKKWRKRWIVVDKNTEDITLFTFKQAAQYKYPTERVILNEDIEIKAKQSTQQNAYEFTLYNRRMNCKFKFRALDEESRGEWMDMLQREKNGAQMEANVSISEEEDVISHHDHDDDDKSEREEKEEVISNNSDSVSSNANRLYDKMSGEVQDCLVLIDDLTYLRYEQDVDSENNRIISQFEHSLKESGFVTKDQMDQLRDVAIRLIGYMLDQPDTV